MKKILAWKQKEAADLKVKAAFLKLHPITGVVAADLKDNWKDVAYLDDNYTASIEAHFTERFGWCFPTLLIAKGRNGYANRTYATTLDGKSVRVGLGPHIKCTLKIRVTKKNVTRLKAAFATLLADGAAKANDIRDAISTKRMRTTMRRSMYGY